MVHELDGRRVACLVANEGVERIELTEPQSALRAAGAEVVVLAPEPGEVQTFDHLDHAGAIAVDQPVAKASVDDFDALLLPGGVANPDQLRTKSEAVEFARQFFDAGKPVAAICHAPWTLVEADAVGGRQITSWPSLQTDIRNAGGEWIDAPVVVCERGPNVLVSSRKPDDLPQFCQATIDAIAKGPRSGGRSAGRNGEERVWVASPAAGVVDASMSDPPEPSEPG
jgi:protease I